MISVLIIFQVLIKFSRKRDEINNNCKTILLDNWDSKQERDVTLKHFKHILINVDPDNFRSFLNPVLYSFILTYLKRITHSSTGFVLKVSSAYYVCCIYSEP